ncbi:MAG: ECF transporter S component [Ruminococcus sp.]|nr:ECF transporter S component [Ruminococcus sp.]
MTNTGKNKLNNKTYRLVGLGILTAIVIVLQVIATYFPTKPFAITLALIPIVIGAAVYGSYAGAYLGAVFSAVVVIMCITGADAGGFMVWQANPVMCVILCMLKGSAAGFFAGLLYNVLSKKNVVLGTVAAAVVAPVANTGIFIIGLLIFFRDILAQWAGGTDIVFWALFIMAGWNFVTELIVNIVLIPVIIRILKAVKAIN